MSLKVYMTRGLPASGKTTFAKELIAGSGTNTIKRINKDDLRMMVDSGTYSKHSEKCILKVRDFMIKMYLHEGKHVIVDDTNFEPMHEKRIREVIHHHNQSFEHKTGKEVTLEIVDFTDVPKSVCLARNMERGGTCPNRVIHQMHSKYIQGKDEPKYIAQDESLPTAIIVDIDGTAALMGDRSPYDASTCVEDEVHHPVREVIDMFMGSIQLSHKDSKVIFLSGRDSKYRAETVEWLQSNVLQYQDNYELFMRAAGDVRKDSIVKKELYDANVKDNYNVLFVLDDRDQVVKMWRDDVKLPCFQVWWGDF